MNPKPIYTYDITESGCHILNVPIQTKGGIPQKTTKLKGKNVKRSFVRYLYEQKYGKLESGKALRHTCKRSDCVNLEHTIVDDTHHDIWMFNSRKPIEYYIDENNCHVITSHSVNGHRPEINIDGKRTIIARYILEKTLGRPILPNMVAMHLCDNGECINPNHIIEATQKENINDAERKGRMNHRSIPQKLTKDIVKQLKNEYKSLILNYTQQYNVSDSTIKAILRGKIWKHVF